MKKLFLKMISIMLAVVTLFSLSVFANAEDGQTPFNLKKFNIIVKDGKWTSDYVGNVTVSVTGPIEKAVKDVVLVVTTESNGKTVVTVKSDKAVIEQNKVTFNFEMDSKINHSENYVFTVSKGAFADKDGNTNLEFVNKISGNKLVEMIPKNHVALKPVEKLIAALEASSVSFLFYPIISMLKWFISL